MLREWPSFGAYFYCYEAVRRKLAELEGKPGRPDELSVPGLLAAGGVGGVASWVITYPVDVLKTMIQRGQYTNMRDAAAHLWRVEGSAGYLHIFFFI